MIIFNIIFIILFVIAACLQYNDPDPYIWMPLYLYGAFLCYQATKRKYNQVLYIVGLIVYGGYAAYLFLGADGVLSWVQDHDKESIVQTMHATKPWIEKTREFGGLVMLLFALVINMIWLRKVFHKSVYLR